MTDADIIRQALDEFFSDAEARGRGDQGIFGRREDALEALARLEAEVARLQRIEQAAALALEVLEDVWTQFSCEINGKNVAGGLSTLEWVEETLPTLRAALAAGGTDPAFLPTKESRTLETGGDL